MARVDNVPVWAPLRPRPSLLPEDQYLDSQIPEVLVFQPMDRAAVATQKPIGVVGHSRYDAHVALPAALAAVWTGTQIVKLKQQYVSLSTHQFSSAR